MFTKALKIGKDGSTIGGGAIAKEPAIAFTDDSANVVMTLGQVSARHLPRRKFTIPEKSVPASPWAA